MKNMILIIQVIIACFLIIAVLLQNKGSGLSGVFGGGGGAVYRTKRGIEKMLTIATVILAIIFFILAIISLLI